MEPLDERFTHYADRRARLIAKSALCDGERMALRASEDEKD